MAFQMKQLFRSACDDAMHESVNVNDQSEYTTEWFEWVRTKKNRNSLRFFFFFPRRAFLVFQKKKTYKSCFFFRISLFIFAPSSSRNKKKQKSQCKCVIRYIRRVGAGYQLQPDWR